MRRPDPSEYDAYYQKYLDLLPDGEVLGLLAQQIDDTVRPLGGLPSARAGYRYADGKWSVREVVGHLIDVERVFAYRALRASRGDATPLPGFEQNDYITAGNYDERPLDALLAEMRHVRQTTLDLFRGMSEAAHDRRGTADGSPFSVRAAAHIIAGHELHHRAILEERYLPHA